MPDDGETKHFTLALPAELHARIAEQARREERSINAAIRQAIRLYLDQAAK